MNGAVVRQVRQRGFTLLEVALVLLIASILFAIALPRLPSLGRTDLEASAERLASTMTYLADEASLRGRIYRLTLDLEQDLWRVAAIAPFSDEEETGKREFREDPDDPMARSVALPAGVFFDAVVDRDGERSAGTREVYFLPEGLTENVGVRLREEGGDETVVELDAVRGTASRTETRRSGDGGLP